MLAMLLDTLSLQLDRIPPRVRGETVRVSRCWSASEAPDKSGAPAAGLVTLETRPPMYPGP
jgi:hypothetical protein